MHVCNAPLCATKQAGTHFLTTAIDWLQKALAKVSERSAAGKFQYSKFFAIGLFRLLEVSRH